MHERDMVLVEGWRGRLWTAYLAQELSIGLKLVEPNLYVVLHGRNPLVLRATRYTKAGDS
jgi:hypothetical protein